MELIAIIAAILLITFGILQIILFFKLWVMTSDIARIKEYIERIDQRASNNRELKKFKDGQEENSNLNWAIGSRVVHVLSGNQMKIISLNSNGTFVCTKDGLVAGSSRRDELMAQTEWLEHIKK